MTNFLNKNLTIPKQVNKNAWLISFVDLITLVLCFFVMIYTTKEHESDKWQGLINSFSRLVGKNFIDITPEKFDEGFISEKKDVPQNIIYFENYIRNFILNNEVFKDKIQMLKTHDSIELLIDDDIDFIFYSKISELLKNSKNRMIIEYFDYSQKKAFKKANQIIKKFRVNGLNKNIYIKIGEDIFLPETQEFKNKIKKFSLIIRIDEEIS